MAMAILLAVIVLVFSLCFSCKIHKDHDHDNSDRPFLYIGVLSAPQNLEKRNAIRQTWLSRIDALPISYSFYIGRIEDNVKIHDQILKENEEFQDISLVDIFDSYRNIHWKTRKIISDGFDNQAAFVMKTDDDSFIRIFELFEELLHLNYKKALYIGLMNYDQDLVQRDSTSPFYLPDHQFHDKYYPIFAYGSGYCMSRQLIRMFMKKMEKLPVISSEDVGTAQWVKLINEPVEYINWNNIDFFGNKCGPDTLIVHKTSPDKMICRWDRYIEGMTDWCC